MAAPPTRLGYGFAPVPIRVFQALRDQRISYDEFVLIAYVYSRASHRALRDGHVCFECTLDQLAEGIASDDRSDTLSRRLRRLRDKPERWFEYTTQGRNRYRFRLFPHAPEPSEVRPSLNAQSDKASRDTKPGARSEVEAQSSEVGGGSRHQPEPSDSTGETGSVRHPQTFQKDTSATSEGWTLDHALETEAEIPWLPEVGEAIEKHRARPDPPDAPQQVDAPTADELSANTAREGEEPQFPYDPEADMYARRIRRKFGTNLRKGLPADEDATP